MRHNQGKHCNKAEQTMSAQFFSNFNVFNYMDNIDEAITPFF